MKAKILTLGFTVLLSTFTAISALAASTESSIVLGAYGIDFTGAVQGQHKYGRITLQSDGKASAFLYKNCDGTWKQTTVNDPEGMSGHLFLDKNGGSTTDNYYMNGACQYKLEVLAGDKGAKGYIRSYD
ncbi:MULTISPECIES: hypothetical protein [Brevibacillus]|uniref:hypothetical protein n=1 Tax=Brevibacillus TaxID=55080 RepID=UPI0019019ED1|nr:hypothetical protein [Brevibacillus brevis]MBH0331051.1 hypothetical protein [Brevibacillus brevis]